MARWIVNYMPDVVEQRLQAFVEARQGGTDLAGTPETDVIEAAHLTIDSGVLVFLDEDNGFEQMIGPRAFASVFPVTEDVELPSYF